MRTFAIVLTSWLLVGSTASAGPYSPAAGQPGSTAISKDDPRIVEWATRYENYVLGTPINNSFTDPTKTLGPAKGTTVDVTELGDGGQITLSFDKPIVSSPSGADLAVFGNSFSDTYLKLAYVDVSADGQNWFRLPNHSLTPGPVSTFGASDTTNIDGLAGKYRVGFGTPFSLKDVGLTSASFVRLVDIIGDGSAKDSAGNPIYDPYPNSNGFNAAGVGVLSVPEPSSLVLMLVGLTLLAIWRRRSPIPHKPREP